MIREFQLAREREASTSATYTTELSSLDVGVVAVEAQAYYPSAEARASSVSPLPMSRIAPTVR
jgi:hypothetical protein